LSTIPPSSLPVIFILLRQVSASGPFYQLSLFPALPVQVDGDPGGKRNAVTSQDLHEKIGELAICCDKISQE
jgi:hypothetical protein